MIYYDLCALSPEQRAVVYQKVRNALNPGGTFFFDVVSMNAYKAREETSAFGRRFMDGFWAEGDYFAFQNTFKYGTENVLLDQYTIVEEHRTWQVLNWMTYFDRSAITEELGKNGFDVVDTTSNFAGSSNGDSRYFGVIAESID